MDEQQTAAAKAAARQQLRAARGALTPEERRTGAQAVRRRLATLPELAAVGRVLGYSAMAEEVDIHGALVDLQGRGVQVVMPWVVPDDPRGRMGLTPVLDLEADLEPGWRGVPEPRKALRRPIRPDLLDAVLAPGVGFDARGRRLGHGGGHFDRLLARLHRGTPVIGVAFDEQIVDSVPAGGHDRRVTVVVTPTRTIRPT